MAELLMKSANPQREHLIRATAVTFSPYNFAALCHDFGGSMNKKLLIHVLENVRDNGEWSWTGDHLLYENEPAQLRFEQSGYTTHEYIVAGIVLVRSGKMLTRNEESRFLPPLCLTLDGSEYLFELKHPVLAWFKRNWFVAAIATATFGLSAFSIGFNVWIQVTR